MNNKKIYLLLLFTFGVVFCVMNFLTPMSGDDYVYCFFFDKNPIVRPTPERVTSFVMLLESMWNHYLVVNGRFVTHVIVQVFCALWGKILFNIANALVFMAFLHVLVLLSRHKYSVLVLAVAYLVSMCILPYPGQTMLWMAGSMNYLWPVTAALLYIYWLQNYVPKKEKWWKYPLVGIITLMISWTNESVSAPIAFGLFIYFIANLKTFKGLNISAFIGYAIGVSLVIFSPGTFSRIGSDEMVIVPLCIDQFFFIHTYNMLYNFINTIFPLIVLVVLVYKFIKEFFKRPMKIFGSLYGCLFLAFVLFLWTLGMIDSRIYFGVSVVSFVIVLKWMYPSILKIRTNRYLAIAMCLLCIVPSYSAISATYKYYVADKKATELVLSSPSRCVIPMQKVPESSRYCFYGGMESLTPYNYDHTRLKKFYYEKDYLQALPNDVYEAWKNDTLLQLTSVNVLKLPSEQEVRHHAFAIYKYLDCTDYLLPRQKAIRRLFNSLTTESREKVYYIEQGDSSYLIFPKVENVISIDIPMVINGEEITVEYQQ